MTSMRFRPAVLGLALLFGWTLPVHAFHTWKKETLPNGMTLLAVEKADVPAVSITLLVKHGTTSEPADKTGVATLTAHLLTEGTRHWSSDQIAARIAAVGGVFATDIGFDDTTMDWAVLKHDLAPALEVLAEVVQHPVFPQAAVARKRRAMRGERSPTVENSPETFEWRALFGDGFSGVPPSRDASPVARIEQRDIVQFHRRAYHPADVILAVAGDVTFAEFKTLATKYFGNWSTRRAQENTPAALSGKTTPAAFVVDRPLAQASLRLAFVGTSATDPATPALELLTHVLANGPESRLGHVLREQRGWTYTVRSQLDTFRQAGVFVISMSVPYEFVLPTLEQSTRELVCLTTTPVTAAELARAKQQATARFYFAMENLPELSHFVARYDAFHAEQEPPERLLTALDRVTTADIQQAAQRYVQPQQAVLTVVGDRSTLKKVAPPLVAGKIPHWASQCAGERK